ncbi:hypothetical protein ECV0102_48850 [Enterobacter cloacae]|nr:hypothetical protein ECV0102_48850 [Enterobacter cloacae]
MTRREGKIRMGPGEAMNILPSRLTRERGFNALKYSYHELNIDYAFVLIMS